MIKYFVLFSISICFAQNNIPEQKIFNDASNYFYSLVGNYKRLNMSFSHHRIPNWDNRPWEQSFINLRYKLTKNWQVGIGHGHQRGDRSNNDWIFKNGQWGWRDTSHRVENLSDFVINYKTLVKTFILDFRQTYRRNYHWNTSRSITRFGINYLNMSCGLDCNIIAHFEKHMSFDDNETEEDWFYLSWLFNISDSLILGPRYVYLKRTWEATHDFQDQTSNDYEEFEILNMFGVQLIHRF
jgi:hypothetical protein